MPQFNPGSPVRTDYDADQRSRDRQLNDLARRVAALEKGRSGSGSTSTAAMSPVVTGGGSGAATGSISLAAPGFPFTVNGSPASGGGGFTLQLSSQAANTAWMAPDGATGTPTFRALVNADFPTISGLTAGTYTSVTVNNKGIVTAGGTATAGAQRTVTSASSSTDRTATANDYYIRLGGTSDATLTLHAASIPRAFALNIRNVCPLGGAIWTIAVVGTDLFYQGADSVTTFPLMPGQSLPLLTAVDGSQGKWEVCN